MTSVSAGAPPAWKPGSTATTVVVSPSPGAGTWIPPAATGSTKEAAAAAATAYTTYIEIGSRAAIDRSTDWVPALRKVSTADVAAGAVGMWASLPDRVVVKGFVQVQAHVLTINPTRVTLKGCRDYSGVSAWDPASKQELISPFPNGTWRFLEDVVVTRDPATGRWLVSSVNQTQDPC